MENKIHEGLQALGKSADTNAQEYKEAIEDGKGVLERFPSPAAQRPMNACGLNLSIHIETSEFTSLCPMTGQPDFAKIVIDYEPNDFCVESKSLKLYFLSYRNKRDFHESCVTTITNDLVELLKPKWMSVRGEFTPRGGIPFWPTAHYTEPKDNKEVPHIPF
jgi:7-cyano-7-deazaguanine reductase